jgi:hypothetical protein
VGRKNRHAKEDSQVTLTEILPERKPVLPLPLHEKMGTLPRDLPGN